MLWRLTSVFFFLFSVCLYLVLPLVFVKTYLVPLEKKELFERAALWKEKEGEVLKKVWQREEEIWRNPRWSEEEKQLRVVLLHRQLEREHPFFQKGQQYHRELLQIGLTLDLLALTLIYFVVGIFLFWLYRKRAKSMGVFSGKIQYTVYLFLLSFLIIVTTFGLGFACSYLYEPSWWLSQPMPRMYVVPLKDTPYIVSHFVIYALNVAIMGPLDLYMTVRPASWIVVFFQWLERVFVITVLFSSISRLWWRPSSSEDPTII